MQVHEAPARVLAHRQQFLLDAFHEFARDTAPALVGEAASSALASLDQELDNITFLLDTILTPEAIAELDALQTLAVTELLVLLDRYMARRGLWWEKLGWTRTLANYTVDYPGRIRSVLYNLIGSALGEIGAHEEAIHFYKLALADTDLPEDDPERARIYGNLGVAYWSAGDLEEALPHMHVAYQAAVASGDMHEEASALADMAQILFAHGDVMDSLPVSLHALQVAGAAGDATLQAQCLAITATILLQTPLREQADELFEEAITLLSELNDPIGLALAQLNYAVCCHIQQQDERAYELVSSALRQFRFFGMQEEIAQAEGLVQQLSM